MKLEKCRWFQKSFHEYIEIILNGEIKHQMNFLKNSMRNEILSQY
jgi:hypothetical protein